MLQLTERKGVRQRVRETIAPFLPEHYEINLRNHKHLLPTPASHVITLLSLLTILVITIALLEKKLPTPLTINDAGNYPGHFIAERAMSNLMKLTSLGPRPTGSYENEVLAVNFFVNEIHKIINEANDVHKISVDIQKPSGAFPLDFLDGLTNVYRNVQNVVVKIGPLRDPGHSLLINCHFDTVCDSPGGSDDGASCAIMLEILYVISQSDTPLKNNIVFLFNGAEENLMQASHGFITQHNWAKQVRAFINLEACGAGGKEILFQAGPNHPWIMQTYSEVVPYPYASSLAQEIFQSGVIPGDTDFRIFRDFGNVSGLDFAWSTNGYVYHTKFDDVHQIPLGTLQRTGDNILALALGMVNGKELSDIERYQAGNMVFFDFLGACVIRWSEHLSIVINLSALFFSAYSVIQNTYEALATGMKKQTYFAHLGFSLGVVLLTWIVTIVFALLIAIVLTALNCTMSWYSHPVWIFFLYVCPSLVVPMGLVLMASWKQKPAVNSIWLLFQIYYDAYQILWSFILLICTMMGIRSGFIALLWTLFPCLGNIIRSSLFRHWRDWKWLVLHGVTLFIPFAQSIYLIVGAMSLCIPIMGRTGAGNNAEMIIAFITSALMCLLLSYVVPLILLVKFPGRVLGLLMSLSLIALGFLLFTSLGFPYSGNLAALAPQRYMLAHTQRIYHDEKGDERSRDAGFWVVDLDQNSPETVLSSVPEMALAHTVEDDCMNELYCGLPYLMPVLTFIWKTHWIPGPDPDIPIPTTLTLLSIKDMDDRTQRMSFVVTGPDHIGVMISPYPGVTLYSWSFVQGVPLAGPKWNGRATYFVYYSCASEPVPWTFWIDLRGKSEVNALVDIAVTSHFLHGPYQASAKFRELIAQFPPWTAVTAWTATYSSWKF